MGWLLALTLLVSPQGGSTAPDVLPSRELVAPPIVLAAVEPANFDLVDMRDDARLEAIKAQPDEEPHTHFIVKRHIGVSGGYDNTIVHGSVGLYLTVAEWGRWNFGAPSIGVGFGRYPVRDRGSNLYSMKSQGTVFVSVASVHYRVGYLRSLGVNWYINLEQVYDLRYNMGGSQFGVSFSRK